MPVTGLADHHVGAPVVIYVVGYYCETTVVFFRIVIPQANIRRFDKAESSVAIVVRNPQAGFPRLVINKIGKAVSVKVALLHSPIIPKNRSTFCVSLNKYRRRYIPSAVVVYHIPAVVKKNQVWESVVVVVTDKNLLYILANTLRQMKFYFRADQLARTSTLYYGTWIVIVFLTLFHADNVILAVTVNVKGRKQWSLVCCLEIHCNLIWTFNPAGRNITSLNDIENSLVPMAFNHIL